MTLPTVIEESGPITRGSTLRRFNEEYKRKIVAEYETLPDGGNEHGSLLRREGLRRSQVYEWRKTYSVTNSGIKKRAPKRSAEQIEIDRLKAKNVKLEAELERTKLALEITGKAHALLEMFSEGATSNNEQLK